MAGGVAGVVTWCFATPMDVVKSRLQMSGAGGREYNGILHCMRLSIREEGARVFFKGLLLNSLRAFPVNAVTFLSYESLLKLFLSMSRWLLFHDLLSTCRQSPLRLSGLSLAIVTTEKIFLLKESFFPTRGPGPQKERRFYRKEISFFNQVSFHFILWITAMPTKET